MASRSSVMFLKRRKGVFDAWVGPLLVGTAWRTRSPSGAGTAWTAQPLGEPAVGDLTLAEAKVVIRLSRRASELSGLLYPEPTPDRFS